MHIYRTVTHVGVSAGYLADTEPQQRFVWVMSPHGARWMASAVDGVCRGGGVVASLMCGVEYDVNVEYGGSVEYDASLKLDVVVICTKITKDKEKH